MTRRDLFGGTAKVAAQAAVTSVVGQPQPASVPDPAETGKLIDGLKSALLRMRSTEEKIRKGNFKYLDMSTRVDKYEVIKPLRAKELHAEMLKELDAAKDLLPKVLQAIGKNGIPMVPRV